MAGEKIQQAREALKFCLSNLNQDDQFNIIPFSHEARRFREGLVAASPENVEAARQFADELKATGGTNINDALLAALDAAGSPDADRPYLIVFLTDGQPTIGVTQPDEILSNVAAKNANRVRLFVFGVGHDVNTILLDTLAERNRGTREYVEPAEDLELKLSSFYRKVSDPVLAELSLDFRDLNVYDMYPANLGDLFSGSELVVTGRYKGEGARAFELTGTRRGRPERFVYETTFPALDTKHEFLPRLWATRKVGFLLDEMRLHGEKAELKDTVVQLATEYGILTPYTAYLVTEPGSIARRPGRRFNPMADAVERAAPRQGKRPRPIGMAPGMGRVVAGRDAVAESRSVQVLRAAEAPDAADGSLDWGVDEGTAGGVANKLVERIKGRTFYRIDDRWVDAAYAQSTETTKVELFSEAYFKLLREHPELAGCFALGERVIVVLDGTAYETVPAPEDD
jgi:Ca-activated chloride channel family protein